MRVLLNTAFFPSSYASWRMVEIKSFIDHYDCDIGILSVYDDHRLHEAYPVNYEETKTYYGLENYNILIFRKKFNFLNKYNDNFDGTRWNLDNNFDSSYASRFPFCYMFVKKNDKRTINVFPYDRMFIKYDLVYHIFYSNFNYVNSFVNIPKEKQAVRLYPGGGIHFNMNKILMDNRVKLITTNIKITEMVKNSNLTNFKEILYGPMLDKNENLNYLGNKKLKNDKLSILFSTAGGYTQDVYERKGYFKYIDLIKYIKSIGKSESFNFYCVGAIQPKFRFHNLNIIYTNLLSQKEFNELLSNTIDITINLHNGGTDGFPQGIEALLRGCVGILNDPNNFNEKTGLNYIKEKEIYIVPYNVGNDYLYNILKNLDNNREKLLEMSLLSQKKIYDVCCYDKQFGDLFSFLKKS